MSKKNPYPVLSIVAAAVIALTGCAQGTAPASSPAVSASQGAPVLTVSEPWVKAADSGMSAAFGTIRNTTDKDVTVVSVSTPASPMAELHETIMGANGTMQMQAKQGGFTVPARGELTLEPGGNHIMLMGLSKPVLAGDEVSFELKTSDGGAVAFTAQGKDFTGANENYSSGESTPSGHDSADHSHSESATPGPSN
ncbi:MULTISPECIES: copper chaperone PCu(A)C [unclassified Arthrobacter]|uniref:copper chaperone PCu(A)C n=1 Tax=unclassified Arthrobacter TaxID=235627 RepID=UPI0028830D69|nr:MULTISPECIES: copper chaperone PCu(A)C [unclassified Arthrobacter]